MKKIIFLLALTFAFCSNTFANGPGSTSETGTACGGASQPTCNVTDCSDPTNGFFTGGKLYTCGHSDDPPSNSQAVCSFIYGGGTYTTYSIDNCTSSTSAPINSGLIFLIIAGGGLAIYFFRKQQLNNSSNLSV